MERKEFSKFLAEVYSHGALMSAIGLGHDLGLFGVFYDTDQPQSLQKIAKTLDLKERYTKEWLSFMVATRILIQDRASGLYSMPESHKEVLKVNTPCAPVISVWGKRSDLVKKCFRKDGPNGFGWDVDRHFFNWYEGCKKQTEDMCLDEAIIPILKQQGILAKLESGITVLDIGCGPGSLAHGLAKRFSNTRFIGIDNDDFVLEIASKNAQNLSNLTIMKGDVEKLQDSISEKVDYVFMYDVLHDLPKPQKALEEINKTLKEDGSFTLIDSSAHSNAIDNIGDNDAILNYGFSLFVCLPASMQSEPYVGYGTCWGMEEMEKALNDAKFKVSSVIKGAYVYYHCTK